MAGIFSTNKAFSPEESTRTLYKNWRESFALPLLIGVLIFGAFLLIPAINRVKSSIVDRLHCNLRIHGHRNIHSLFLFNSHGCFSAQHFCAGTKRAGNPRHPGRRHFLFSGIDYFLHHAAISKGGDHCNRIRYIGMYHFRIFNAEWNTASNQSECRSNQAG